MKEIKIKTQIPSIRSPQQKKQSSQFVCAFVCLLHYEKLDEIELFFIISQGINSKHTKLIF